MNRTGHDDIARRIVPSTAESGGDTYFTDLRAWEDLDEETKDVCLRVKPISYLQCPMSPDKLHYKNVFI